MKIRSRHNLALLLLFLLAGCRNFEIKQINFNEASKHIDVIISENVVGIANDDALFEGQEYVVFKPGKEIPYGLSEKEASAGLLALHEWMLKESIYSISRVSGPDDSKYLLFNMNFNLDLQAVEGYLFVINGSAPKQKIQVSLNTGQATDERFIFVGDLKYLKENWYLYSNFSNDHSVWKKLFTSL